MIASGGVPTRILRWQLVSWVVVALVVALVGPPPVVQTAQAAVSQYTVDTTVTLTGSNPQLTAVDPFANGLTPSNPLKPPRPFWYTADSNGLWIMGLRTETTGALMIGGPPIDVVENEVVGYVPWPDAIAVAQPDGEVATDPTDLTQHDGFAWRSEVGGSWEPVGITVSYPTDEALASNSETPPTFVYVVMKHSGYEWQSTATGALPNGRDPNLRDKFVAQSDLTKDDSLLVQVDVSQPNYPADLFPTGAPIGGGLLGHDAGQPAFDPASDSVYVGNMPTTSLPTTPTVPVDLTSFVSQVTIAPGELPAPGEGPPAPVTVTVLCGPEHPDIALLGGFPEAWACIAEGGEGPFTWTFTNLPAWLTAHTDPITGHGDGILYGTPPLPPGPVGSTQTYTFQAHVDDYATTPPGTGDATITLLVSNDPASEYENGELEWEVGVPAAVAIEGTQKAGTTGDPCALTPTESAGSLVPAWVDMVQITGRHIDNSSLGGPAEDTIGCVLMGTPPISGQAYEFQMPNFQFVWPSQGLPVVISGQILGPYTFDALPTGVGLSGLAWHEIDKIHDASTEADLLNREFFGVEPATGQMYRIVPAYAGLEAEGTIVPPPALEGELDEVTAYTEVLSSLTTARPDIAAVLAANPGLSVRFGDLVAEAQPEPNVYVSAVEIFDPTGVAPTIPIGGPVGSQLAIGALMKVSGTRDANDPEVVTMSKIDAIALPGVQAYSLGLDSDLTPAVRGTDPGQVDHGILLATGTSTGNVEVVDTARAKYAQLLAIPEATALGGSSFYPDTSKAYVAGKSLQKVAILGPGTAPDAAPVIWSANSASFMVGTAGSFTIMATGSPARPTLSYVGTLPVGVTFTNNGDGTATLAGTPALGTDLVNGGVYPLTITATNGIGTPATQAFTLTVNPGAAPQITSAASASFATGLAGSFTVTATGSPKPALTYAGTLPEGVTFVDNKDGTATLAGTPALGTEATYPLTITAANGLVPDHIQAFTLTVQVGTPPAITSGDATAFSVGNPGSFTVTTTGAPTPALSEEGALPLGVTFADNGDGTATLSGTPATGTQGSYPFTIKAANGLPSDFTQAFTLTVHPPEPAFTSADKTTFTVGAAGSFSVTTTGKLPMTVTEWGTLPGGVTFVDNGYGTATLAGTPSAAGNWLFVITAANGVQPNAVQYFTLAVIPAGAGTPPAITSSDSTTFTVGTAGSFSVTTSGYPTPTLTRSGALPGGVTFVDDGDGTATLAGTPAAGTGGSYPFTITASNGVGTDATQAFTLTVSQAAAITSANSATFTVGAAGTFSVTTSGNPAGASMTISESGALPSGVTFTDNHDGTATLAGMPAAETGKVYPITITASNGVGSPASQAFTLTVNQAPLITSVPATAFTVGAAGSFSVTTTGYPTAAVTNADFGTCIRSALPGGVTFTPNAGGTATIAGTPAAGTGGVYTLCLNASNGVGSAATQTFTLTVNEAPTITSDNTASFTVGAEGSSNVVATGYPLPTLSVAPNLPSGLSFEDNGDGTATLAGTPAAGTAGSYPLTITAANLVKSVTQAFTLTINAPGGAPTITSASEATFEVGTAGSFIVTTNGSPTPTLTLTGRLPRGVTFKDNGDGTATLAGTPAARTAGTYALTIKASNGVQPDAAQAFSLIVPEPLAVRTGSLTSSRVGQSYTYQLVATGGSPDYTWEISAGSLPAGLTLSPSGQISGTPTNAGTYTFTVRVTDSAVPSHSVDKALSLTIRSARR